MVYTTDSKSVARKGVRVRLPLWAQKDLENPKIFSIFVMKFIVISWLNILDQHRSGLNPNV